MKEQDKKTILDALKGWGIAVLLSAVAMGSAYCLNTGNATQKVFGGLGILAALVGFIVAVTQRMNKD